MEFLSYFPEEIRCLILSHLCMTLCKVEEYRKDSSISNLLDRSVEYLFWTGDIAGKKFLQFPNLRITVGNILINDDDDLKVLNRLTEYSAEFIEVERLMTFITSVHFDHFKRGVKNLYFGRGVYRLWITFKNGSLEWNTIYSDIDVLHRLLRIVIDRQLFDALIIRHILDESVPLLNSIHGLKEVELIGIDYDQSLSKLKGIWTQVETIIYKSGSYTYLITLLKMLKRRYGKLSNVKRLIISNGDAYSITHPLIDLLTTTLFPNLEK